MRNLRSSGDLRASPAQRRRDGAILLGIVLLAAGSSLYALGRKGLWYDEITSVQLAEQSWHTVWRSVTTYEMNMGLYNIILWAWLRTGGGDGYARLPSVAFAVASVPLVWLSARRLFGARVAHTAALLLAVSGFFVEYAQEARAYSLLLLAVAVSMYAVVRIIETPAQRWVIVFIAATVVGVYAHFFMALVTAAELGSLAILPQKKVHWKWLAPGLGALTVLLIPLALHLRSKGGSQIAGFPPLHPREIARVGKVLVGGREGVPKDRNSWADPRLELLALEGLAVVAFYATGYRAIRQRSSDAWSYLLVGSCFALPFVVSIFISYTLQPVFEARYFIVSLPPLVIMVGVAVERWLTTRWALVTVALTLLLSCASLARWYGHDQKEEWRPAVTTVLAGAPPGEAIFFMEGSAWGAFDFYADRIGLRYRPTMVYPTETWHSFVEGAVPVPRFDETSLDALTRGHDRLWLVLSHDSFTVGMKEQTQIVDRYLRRHYRLSEAHDFTGVRVRLFVHAS